MKRFKVITLCGSTKFKDTFIKVAEKLTLEGNIVLMPNCYSHADNKQLSDSEKQMLINIHHQMMDMSDEIFVVDVGGYIGSNTKSEIQYVRDAIDRPRNIVFLTQTKYNEEGGLD